MLWHPWGVSGSGVSPWLGTRSWWRDMWLEVPGWHKCVGRLGVWSSVLWAVLVGSLLLLQPRGSPIPGAGGDAAVLCLQSALGL